MKIAVHDILTNEELLLNEHTRIRFGDGHSRVTVSVRDGAVEISGDSPLALRPVAANVVIVTSSR